MRKRIYKTILVTAVQKVYSLYHKRRDAWLSEHTRK